MFLGAFTKLPKATSSFVMSVRPFAWNNLAPTGWIFTKFYIWGPFLNTVENLISVVPSIMLYSM